MPDQFLCSNEVHKSIAAQVREEEREKIRAIVAHAIKEERERVLTEVIKIVSAYERKPKYDYEATLCSVIVESLESLRTTKEGQ